MSPAGLSGCDLLLFDNVGVTTTAAGGVSAWADQSGAGNNLTQATAANQPQAVGGPRGGVFFNGSSWLNFPSGFAHNDQSFTAVAVLDRQPTGTNLGAVYGATAVSNTIYLYTLYGQSRSYQNGNDRVVGLPAYSNLSVLGITGSPSASQAFNDVAQGTPMPAFSTTATTGGSLGAYGGGNGPLLGFVRCFAHFNRVLSGAEIATLVAYLKSAYGLTAAPRVNLVADGDSITWGGVPPFADGHLAQLDIGEPVRVVNLGLSGVQIGNSGTGMVQAQASKVFPLFDPSCPYNVLATNAATNDIVSTIGNQTGAQAFARLAAYGTALKASNPAWLFFPSTLLPRGAGAQGGSGGLFEVDRQVFNALVRAGAPWMDGYSDYAADPIIGPAAASGNPFLFDGAATHPLATASGAMARILGATLRKAISPAALSVSSAF